MIPAGSTLANAPIREVRRPSRTWKLDLEARRVTGTIDGLEAVKQAVFKLLQTARYRFEIYSFQYGHELERLIGTSPVFLQSEVSRFLQETLLQDERILGVEQLQVSAAGENLLVKFTVVSHAGIFQVSQEVG